MTHATDLIWIALLVVAGCAVCYALLVRRLRQVTAERDLKIADQLGALDAAIQALETRLAEHREVTSLERTESAASVQEEIQAEGESIAGKSRL